MSVSINGEGDACVTIFNFTFSSYQLWILQTFSFWTVLKTQHDLLGLKHKTFYLIPYWTSLRPVCSWSPNFHSCFNYSNRQLELFLHLIVWTEFCFFVFFVIKVKYCLPFDLAPEMSFLFIFVINVTIINHPINQNMAADNWVREVRLEEWRRE